ncbi:MAG: HNH endonuclease [Acidobacteriia bacterium]|nr:HNH endonuclease [Terriglobia bacterium]
MIDAAARNRIRQRAGDRCEYCRLSQKYSRRTHHIEHIVAKQHGGADDMENLALACHRCNLQKGLLKFNSTLLNPAGGAGSQRAPGEGRGRRREPHRRSLALRRRRARWLRRDHHSERRDQPAAVLFCQYPGLNTFRIRLELRSGEFVTPVNQSDIRPDKADSVNGFDLAGVF